MFKTLKKHYLIIALALTVGILSSLPQILAARESPNFKGIYKTVNNDETYYLARARDIIDGHVTLGNPYLFEHKNEQPLQFWLPDYILAKPLAVLGVKNIQAGYIFYDFLLTFILTILTYSVIFLLAKSKPISFLGAAFLHFNLFFNWFNRSPSPQLTFIFWLVLFLFWLKFLKSQNYKYTLLTGLSFGLLFHIYTYYWTFYFVFFAIFIILNFLLKKEMDYKKYFFMFLTAFVIALPYFISIFKSLGLPYYNETLMRVGMVDTHFPSGRKIVMWGLLVLIFMAISYRKKIIGLNQKTLLLLSGILAAIISTNQNIITGKNLQFASHYWMLSVFIFIFSFAYTAKFWLKNIKSRHLTAFIFVLIFIFVFYSPVVYAINVFSGKSIKYSSVDIMKQNYAPIFDWFNKNTVKDDVIFTNSELSSLIPIYTSNNIYSNGLAGLHFMLDSELQERFVINNFWDNIDAQYAIDHKFSIWGSYHQTVYDINRTKNKVSKLLGLNQVEYVKIPQEDIDDFFEFAREIQSRSFEEQLKKYRIDYLVWDKNKDKNWRVESLDFLKPLVEINDLVIYRVN